MSETVEDLRRTIARLERELDKAGLREESLRNELADAKERIAALEVRLKAALDPTWERARS